MIPVYKPYFPEGSLRYAHDALDSTWVSSKGKYLDKVKEWLADYYGTEYIILTNNGTAANHLMAIAVREKYPEKHNLICPNNSYVAAWNPFVFSNKFNLNPVDANKKTWNMDYSGKYIEHWSDVFLAVHNLGNIVNVPAIRSKRPKTVFIEDNCEGFGGWYENKRAGTASEAFSLSFFGNKNVTSGEGGAFVTYSEHLYKSAFRFWGQGMEPGGEQFIHSGLGHNYRMTNVEAAILLGQLEIFPLIQELKAEIFYNYKSALCGIDGIQFQMNSFGTEHSNWMFGVKFKRSNTYMSDKFFKMYGIETRPMFYPITKHKQFKDIKCTTDEAEKIAKEVVVFPSHPGLTKEEQDYIIGAIKDYARELSVL